MGFVDIHCHIMPGVDDGSKDTAMTGRMLEIAYNDGIDTMIVTPHYMPGQRHVVPSEIERFADRLSDISNRRGWPMNFYAGNELLYHSDCIGKLDGGRVCTLADTAYVLVEFEKGDSYRHIQSGVRALLSAGYYPILAHAERYATLVENIDYIENIVNSGCLLQVNASSVMGDFGRDSKIITGRLLNEGFVHFVATDAHSDGRRAPRMKKCFEYMCRHFGEDYSEELCEFNARKILAGERVV